MVGEVEQLAVMHMRGALAHKGIKLDEVDLNGAAACLVDLWRGIESLRELRVAPLMPPAHCHSKMP